MNASKTESRAALWLCVSTGEQSLDPQESALRALAEEQGHCVVTVYGIKRSAWSGSQDDEFVQLLKDGKDGHFTHVLVWSLDRLDRQGVLSTLKKLEQLDDAGINLVSYQERWLDQLSSVRGLLISVIAWVAQWESERRSERVKARKDDLSGRGLWPGGKPPYGYTNEEGVLVKVDEEARNVELIYSMYADQAMGQRRIEDELWRRGFKGRKGRRFHKNSIHRILNDPTYLGEHPNGVKAPIIVDKEMKSGVEARMRENRHLRPAKSKTVWPLQGMKCGVCGSRISVDSGGSRRRTYYCRGRQKDSGYHMRTGKTCTAPRLSANDIEDRLLSELTTAMRSPETFITTLDAAISRLEAQEQELATDIGPLIEEIEELNRQLIEIDRARTKGRIPSA